MSPEHMDDLEIKLAVEKECDLRRDAQSDPNADPSLYAPWGILQYGDEDLKRFKTDRPD